MLGRAELLTKHIAEDKSILMLACNCAILSPVWVWKVRPCEAIVNVETSCFSRYMSENCISSSLELAPLVCQSQVQLQRL